MLAKMLTTWKEQKYWYAVGFLVSTFLFALLVLVSWHNSRRNLAEQRATGLAAIAQDPFASVLGQGVIGGVAGGVSRNRLATMALSVEAASERQVVKRASMEVAVTTPNQTAERVGELVERLGGYVVSLTRTETENRIQAAEVVLRVPAGRFDEARSEIRKLANRIESEKVESQDITSSYTDKTSRLSARRAVEAQYLEVLRRASSVKDILEVHEKLGEIREEIETAEGALKLMSHQVAMAAVSVRLTAEGPPLAFGIRWKPKDAFKRAANNALQALADYAEAMVELALLVPVILLWTFSIGVFVGCAWRLLRWLWRFFINRPTAPAAVA